MLGWFVEKFADCYDDGFGAAAMRQDGRKLAIGGVDIGEGRVVDRVEAVGIGILFHVTHSVECAYLRDLLRRAAQSNDVGVEKRRVNLQDFLCVALRVDTDEKTLDFLLFFHC